MGGVLLLLHLLGVVLWVGGMGFGVMALRPSLAALDAPTRLGLMGRVHTKFFRIVWVAMPLVVLSGYLLMFGVHGGFRGVTWPIHVMHLLGLIMAGIFATIWFGPYKKLMRALAEGPAGLPLAAASNESIRKLVGINFTLGVIAIAMGAFWQYAE